MNKIYQKPFFDEKNAGFTLIELLVVVLIIGILSAVALPQYTKAVLKTRRVGAITISKSIKDNFEIYRLANGKYPEYRDFADLVDFGEKQCSSSFPYVCRMGDYIAKHSIFVDGPTVIVMYAPGTGLGSVASFDSAIGGGFWTDNSGKLSPLCAYRSSNKSAKSICESLPRTDKSQSVTNSDVFGPIGYYHTEN